MFILKSQCRFLFQQNVFMFRAFQLPRVARKISLSSLPSAKFNRFVFKCFETRNETRFKTVKFTTPGYRFLSAAADQKASLKTNLKTKTPSGKTNQLKVCTIKNCLFTSE